MQILKGKTDLAVYLLILDSSSTVGAGLTGLAFNTASLVAYYVRELGSATSITLATQTVTGTHSDGGFVEISSANMPGLYRFDLPDAVLASGVDHVTVMLKGATNMMPVAITIELVAYNPYDSVRIGLTSLPNTPAGNAGGIGDVTLISGDNTAPDRLEAWLDAMVAGTSDSGSTTTMVDAALTQADNDWWKGSLICFTSGTVAGQSRTITGFVAATDTITFSPATTAAVSTQTYVIIPGTEALRPTTAGRTFDVDTDGAGEADVTKLGGSTTRLADLVDFVTNAAAGDLPYTINTVAVPSSTDIRQAIALASGTSDSGSTTTMVDAARTEADTDYWAGAIIVFRSGTLAGQARVITGFVAATDTITFSPATTAAVSTQTYDIWPAGLASGFTTAAKAELQAEANDALVANGLDRFNGMIVLDGAVYQYTANALELAPSGGLTAQATRDAMKLAASAGAAASESIDDKLDDLDVTIAAVGITITPILATVTNPRYSTRDLPPIAQYSAPAEAFTVTDSTGAAVNLSGKTVRFVAYLVTDTNEDESIFDDELEAEFQYETGGSGITISGAGSNVVTVQHDDDNTQTAGNYRYFLWNVTDKLVLATGKMPIIPSVFEV